MEKTVVNIMWMVHMNSLLLFMHSIFTIHLWKICKVNSAFFCLYKGRRWMKWGEFTGKKERKEGRGRERRKRKRENRGRWEEIIERVIFVLLLFQIIMKAPLLPRGRTPVTLTVEEPRKFCVLFHLFHCTHRRFYNTLSAREAIMSVESTTP